MSSLSEGEKDLIGAFQKIAQADELTNNKLNSSTKVYKVFP